MEQQDIRILKVFEALEGEQPPSQRELAKKLNISLGLANSSVKRLVSMGYFKAKNISQKRLRYILTPKGAAEKIRLSEKYIIHSFKFYNEARLKFNSLFNSLTEKNNQCRIILCGANELAEIAYISSQGFPVEIIATIDFMREKNNTWLGKAINNIEYISQVSFDIIIITRIMQREKAYNRLVALGVDENKIIKNII